MKPERLTAELRRHQRHERTKFLAAWACMFTISWFAIHFIMGAVL